MDSQCLAKASAATLVLGAGPPPAARCWPRARPRRRRQRPPAPARRHTGRARRAPAKTLSPIKGGTLTVGIYQEPPTLDPHVSGSATAGRVIRHIFDSLVYQPQPGTFEPGLATSWDTPDNGKTWTFKLRTGVTFHDGTPFNAQAVKFSFDRIVDPKTKSLSAIGQMGPYASTEVVDDATRESELHSAARVLPEQPVVGGSRAGLANRRGQIRRGLRSQPGRHRAIQVQGVGGRLADHDRAQRRATPGRPAFLGRNGPALLDAVQFKFLLEPATRTGALQKGEVLMIDQTPDQDVAGLKQDGKFRIDTIVQPARRRCCR